MYCRSFKRKPQECWNRGAIPLLVLAKVYIRGCTPFNNNNDYAPLNYPAQQVMIPGELPLLSNRSKCSCRSNRANTSFDTNQNAYMFSLRIIFKKQTIPMNC